MPDRLPLFPLGLVLLPGLVLPLHVFEDRYRALVRELLAAPERERRFGVVAIRQGREVGADGVRALHEVGCVAQVQRVVPHPDGRFDVVTVGAQRFRLAGLLEQSVTGRPYLTGLVEPLPEDPGDPDESRLLAAAVRPAVRAYAEALAGAAGGTPELSEVPEDPGVLSYAVAASVQVDLADRQALLAVPRTPDRLRAELALLRRERRLLSALRAVPAPELARVPVAPN